MTVVDVPAADPRGFV